MKPRRLANPHPSPPASEISGLIRREQWEAVRRGMLSAIPVNILLSMLVASVAWKSGKGALGV
ncbi:hypothetical protein ACSFA0_25870 [Variovorax sp. LT1P1]|uniref:hypothetical protein n=1 Tax=Variovorax sp. LT1P1 TaxID=3443730 RepID=UPI003F4896C6